MKTRREFDNTLVELQSNIIKLGTMVEERIAQAIDSLANQDMELANQVIVNDLEVNDLQSLIEEKCTYLIATQQPFAIDLRKIVAGFKISINLERMGDLAVNIAKIAVRIAKTPLIKPLIDVPRMSEIVRQMIEKGLKAYVDGDKITAVEMAKMDDGIDHLYNQIFRELLLLMMEDTKTITQATYLLFVARHLERLGDYCTNIAEEIVYLVTGSRSDLNE